MNIIKAHAINNLCYKTSKKMTPLGIVVHSTGANNPMLKRYVDCPELCGINKYGNHWNQPKPGGRSVCVHAFIGYDKDGNISIAEILPLNICCWGVGNGKKGSYNYDPAYIQFEICEDDLKNEEYYRKAFGIAIEYSAFLCQKHGFSTDNIVGHCEAYKLGYGSNHADPEHWMKNFGESMETFRRAVQNMMNDNRKNDNTSSEDSQKNHNNLHDDISDGDLVSIASNATYYSGKAVPLWVKKQNWYVKGTPKDTRVVIDKNEAGTNSICSPIDKKFLTIKKKKSTECKKDNTLTKDFKEYKVKITTDCLNIRKNPGTDNVKVGAIIDKGVYTIVEESEGTGASLWGKLKSNAGWISLDYTKKV